MTWKQQKLFDGCPLDLRWVEKKMLLKFPQQKWLSGSVEPVNEAGFMAHLTRITIEYEDSPKNSFKMAPKKILVKIPNYQNAAIAWKSAGLIDDDNAIIQGIGTVKLLTETEGRFYSIIDEKKCSLKVPDVFYINLDTSDDKIQCIIMEEILDVTKVDIIEGLNKTQLYSAVDFIIELHTLSLLENLNDPGPTYEEWNKLPLNFNDYVANARKRYVKEYPDTLKPLIETVYDECFKDVEDTEETKYNCLKYKPHMCFISHGDLWTSNILFDKKDKNTIKSVVDWQLSQKTSPFEDLTHLLFSCISPELRRQCQGDIFKYYYKNLKDSIEKHGKLLPFNYEDLVEVFYEVLPHLVNRNFFAISMWTGSPLCKTGKSDEEERTCILNSRLKALLEDVITKNLMK